MASKTEETGNLQQNRQTQENSDNINECKAKLVSNLTKSTETTKNINTDQEDKQIAELSNIKTESANKGPKTPNMDLQNEKTSTKNKEDMKPVKEETSKASKAEIESIAQKRSETEDIKDELQKETTLIDISIIGEKEDKSSDQKTENEASEIASALSDIPGISLSVSQEILSKLKDDPTKDIDEIESEEILSETLMDITVVDEYHKDNKVQKEEELTFEAEIIGDEEDITITPKEDEDVIEYTLETKHIVPFLTILAALVAIFIRIIFYNN